MEPLGKSNQSHFFAEPASVFQGDFPVLSSLISSGIQTMGSTVPRTFTAFNSLITSQWHLRNSNGIDINVERAWQDYSGRGVTVGVVDEGVQYSNTELSANYNDSIDYDVLRNVADGSNKYADQAHGTMVSGVIAADDNGTGTTGVAHGATITSTRMLGTFEEWVNAGGEQAIYNALQRQSAVDVSNNSWGWSAAFADGSIGSQLDQILEDVVTNGRGGKGTVMVFAAGNSGNAGLDTNYNELNNSRFVLNVGAINSKGGLTYFSTPGSNVLVSAPGQDIYTTTVNNQFARVAGTSFSAPIVSGVVALMLEANSDLGYRDVQEILAYSSRRVGSSALWSTNDAGNWNGGGLHFNHGLGFGLVNATAAVRLAETWGYSHSTAQTIANESMISFSSGNVNQALNDYSTINSSLAVNSDFRVEHVEVQANFSHDWVGDVTMSLSGPGGTQSLLLNRPELGWNYSSYDSTWSFSSVHNWGENARGNWTLSLKDSLYDYTGFLQNWTIRFYGTAINTDNTFIYTDEFGLYKGSGDAARRILSDASGADTLNTSAVSSNSNISLVAGTKSKIAGNTLTIASSTTIENAIGGDGHDIMTGNSVDNTLWGGRGNDNLNGAAGSNSLYGEAGNDILKSFTGNDTLSGGAGNDTYWVQAGSHSVTINDDSTSTLDKLFLGTGFSKANVAFFFNNGDLQVGNTSNLITISDQDGFDGIERIDLGTTSLSRPSFYMSSSVLDQLIQDMASYATNNGITLSGIADVSNNSDLMTMISNSWQAA